MSVLLHKHAVPERRYVARVVRDTDSGLVLIKRQDVREIVEDCKRLASMVDRHTLRANNVRSTSGTMVAYIPNVIWAHLMRLGITRDPKALRRWLSRRDTRQFRVDDGRRLI